MQKDSTKNKIESIQNQILKLKEKKLKAQKDLEKSQHTKIMSLIKKENGFSHDLHVLAGAIFESLQSLNSQNENSEKLQKWKAAGENLFKKKASQKHKSENAK